MSYPDGLKSIIGDEPLFVTLAEYDTLKGYLCLTKTCLVTVSLDIVPVVINVSLLDSYSSHTLNIFSQVPFSFISGVILDAGDDRLFELKRTNHDSIIFLTQSRTTFISELEIRWKTERMTVLKRYIPFNIQTGNLRLEGRTLTSLAPSLSLPPKFPPSYSCNQVIIVTCSSGVTKCHWQDLHLSFLLNCYQSLLSLILPLHLFV